MTTQTYYRRILMKLTNQNSHVETDIDRSQTREFTIKQNPHTFRILSDSIYSDKPLAVVRELSCNAWDAHIQAGNTDEPFHIHLPSSFEPFFSIKDFGVGLSEDDIYDLYCTYGGTNKDQSNDFTGGFGLGSKSPFAYTDQFTVTSIHGGKKMIFNAFIAESGAPNIVKLSEEPSDEHNGLEVYMPVQEKDFSAFKDKAKTVFKRFPVMPLIDGIAEFKIDPVEYIEENSIYKLRKGQANQSWRYYPDKATALMGLVAYPLSTSSMGDLTNAQRGILNSPFDIIFDMGSIAMTASREQLNYDDVTVKVIKDKLDEILKDLPKALTKQLSACKNKWQACEVYNDWYSKNTFDSSIRDHIGKTVKYKGKEINGKIYVELFDVVDEEYMCPIDQKKKTKKVNEYYGEFLEYQKAVFDLKRISARRESRQSFKPGAIKELIILDDEKARNTNVKIDYNFRDKETAVTLIRLDDMQDLPKVKKQLCGYKLTKMSDYDDPPKGFYERKVAERQVKKLLSYNGSYESWSNQDVEHDVADGGIYVMTFSRVPQLNNNDYFENIYNSHSNMRDIVRKAQEAGLLDEDVPIYGIQASFKNIVKKNDGWVHLLDHIGQQLEKKAQEYDLNRVVSDHNELKANLDSHLYHFLKKNENRDIEWRSVRTPMARLHKAVGEMTHNVNNSLFNLIDKSKTVKVRNIKPQHDIESLCKLCTERYPALDELAYKNYNVAKHYVDVCDASPSIKIKKEGE